jgi:hypothetical protein
MSNFMKIRPMRGELFRADGRIDEANIVTYRNFANLPKNDEHFTRGVFLRFCPFSRSQMSRVYRDK